MTRPPYISSGQVFNRLTALEDARISRDKIAFRCVCGTEKRISAEPVKRGASGSCGCLHIEIVTATIRALGGRRTCKSKHPLYRTWKAMMERAYRPKTRSYPRYGGRGIKVCERWHDAETFCADIDRTLGPRPGRGWSLDRIDNDGHYEPGNLRWATAIMQAANKTYPQRKPNSQPRKPAGKPRRRRYDYRGVVRFIATWQPGPAE